MITIICLQTCFIGQKLFILVGSFWPFLGVKGKATFFHQTVQQNILTLIDVLKQVKLTMNKNILRLGPIIFSNINQNVVAKVKMTTMVVLVLMMLVWLVS